MKNLLLNADPSDTLVLLIIIGVFLIAAVVVFLLIKRASDPAKNKKLRERASNIDYAKSMAIKIPFLNNAENGFLYNFQRVLPDEYVVYPKISLGEIVSPYNNMEFYNQVKTKTLDFVVFLKRNMQPVVVLDLHDRTGAQKSIREDDKMLFAALENVKLPIVSYEIRQDYDLPALLGRFLDALDPLAIANLKKNRDNM